MRFALNYPLFFFGGISVLLELRRGVCCIGIDQDFTIVDFNIGKVEIMLKLFYYFCDVKINDAFVYVMAELEVIKINGSTFDVVQEYGLPDIYEEIEFVNGSVIVSCMGGEQVVL